MKKKTKLEKELSKNEKRIAALDAISFTEEHDEEFRKSLIHQWIRFGELTGKQWYYVDQLTDRYSRIKRMSK